MDVHRQITQPSGRTVEFGYDGSRQRHHRHPEERRGDHGRANTDRYDGSHRVISVTRVLTLSTDDGATTRFAYPSATQIHVAGPTTDQALPVGSVPRTTYTVNSAAKRTSAATDPLGRSRSATYRAFNDVASVTNAAGTSSSGHSPA